MCKGRITRPFRDYPGQVVIMILPFDPTIVTIHDMPSAFEDDKLAIRSRRHTLITTTPVLDCA